MGDGEKIKYVHSGEVGANKTDLVIWYDGIRYKS